MVCDWLILIDCVDKCCWRYTSHDGIDYLFRLRYERWRLLM